MTEKKPWLTVAICTHNRSGDLDECLAALSEQDLTGVEIIVVDSASASDERDQIRNIAQKWRVPVFLRNDLPGLSLARNSALASARSDWLAFLDDDVVVGQDWVCEASRLVSTVSHATSVIAGRVDPIYPTATRPRLGRRWAQLLSLVQVPGEFEGSRNVSVVCANVIFRRDELRAVGGFPLQLGRVGRVLLSGEEKLVIEQLCDRQQTVCYSDRLCAGHKVAKERLYPKWASSRAYWDGVTDEKIRRLMRKPVPALKLAKMALALPVLAALYPVKMRESEFFIRFWYAAGYFREWLWQVRVAPER